MKNYFMLKKSKLWLLTLFAGLVGGVNSASAETLTENFNGDLPEGWSLVGDLEKNSDRARSGSGVWTSSKSDNANYLVTEAVEGSITFYARAYNKNANAYVFIYAYDGSALGDQLYVTENMKTSSTPSFSSYTANLGDYKGQVAIALNYAAIDDMTYTQKEAAEGPAFTVKDGSKVSSPYTYNFGLAIAGTTHVLTLSNPGTVDLGVSVSETTENGSFNATLSAATIVAGDAVTLTLTMPDATASSTVTITPDATEIEPFVINVSGTIRDANKVYLDFADGSMPQGWISDGNGSGYSNYDWTPSTGYISYSASNSTYAGKFVSPVLNFTNGEEIFFETTKFANSTWYNPSVTVEYTTDKTGATGWTAIGDAFTDDVYGEWTQRSVTIPVDGVKRIRFNGWYISLRNIYGGEMPEGAKFAINTNGTTQDFGLVGQNLNKSLPFTITNSGSAALPVSFTDAADFYVAKTVMFTKPNDWTGEKLYMYAFDGTGYLTAAWPGDEVTNAAQNDFSQWIYTAALPKGATTVIFNDGTNQTPDIPTSDFKDVVALWLNGSTVDTWKNEDFIVPAKSGDVDGSATFFVGMNTKTLGSKSGEITLAFDALNATSFTIPVKGAVVDRTALHFDFDEDKGLPEGWTTDYNTIVSVETAGSSNYIISNGYTSHYVTTQKVEVKDGEAMMFQARRQSSYTAPSLAIKYAATADATEWTTAVTLTDAEIPSATDWTVLSIDAIPAGDWFVRFEGKYFEMDNIYLYHKSQNDPKMGVYTAVDFTDANKITTSSVKNDYGFLAAAPDAPITYYIKNDGTGTMNLTLADGTTGLTASLDKTSVAADEYATLTITKDATKGYFGGDAVVTATGLGNFTVSVVGVLPEEGKFDLDFTSQDIPASWTKNDWTKNSNGFIEVNYSSAGVSLETTTLTAVAGEKLVVKVKNSQNYGRFGMQIKKVGDENWADLAEYAYQGSEWTLLAKTIAEAGDYLLRFTGNCAQIQRIYGLSKPNAPEMVVYDGETVAAASFNFGKVTDERDAEKTFTVKNEGQAELAGLTATLSGDNADHYTVAVSAETVAAGESATVTVTQLKDNLGAHSAVLTISATGVESKEIALSGNTVDHTALDVDFDTSNEWPAGWQHYGDWSIYYSTYTNTGYAYHSNSTASAASSLISTPLTVAATTDKLTFQAQRYGNSNYQHLTVRYTKDGGVTWTNYNFGTEEEPVYDLNDQIVSSLKSFEITGLEAGTYAFDFNGNYLKMDNFSGDMKVANAPMLSLTENGAAAEDKDFGNLSADKDAIYTLANNGNADLVSTVAVEDVTAVISGDDVTIDGYKVTVPAGKSATIKVTMAFAAPYGAKTGKMTITSEGWVGDVEVNYTAEAVDPSDFVEDFENGKPAGWYAEAAGTTWSGWHFGSGAVSISAGTAKPMITEKFGAEEGKNVLSFDAKAYSGESQTLNVYTSADRKTWSEAQTFALTNEMQTFSLAALADGEFYVKFEAANATIDNVKGVKRLVPAPEHDLYLVSATLPTVEVTPGKSITATVNVASLRAEEIVAAELYFGEEKVAELTEQTITTSATKAFTLTGTAPAAGTYDVYAKVYNANIAVETVHESVTIADTYKLKITDFAALQNKVETDEDNNYSATFTVTVENVGTGSIAAGDVSVSLVGAETFTSTWTAENSNVLYMNTVASGNDMAADCTLKAWCWNTAEDGLWATFTNVNPGFWSLDLNGKTNFIICRVNPAGTDENPWNNVWNKSADMTLAAGNLVKFTGYKGETAEFTSESMTMLEPTMTTTLKVTVTGKATEDATVSFTAKENVSNTTYNMSRSVSVTAFKTMDLVDTQSFENATTTLYNKVTLNRPFKAGWNTVALPFDMDEATFVEKFGADATLYAYDSNNNGNLTFTATKALVAGTPYLLYLQNDNLAPMEFSNITVATHYSVDRHDVNRNSITFRANYVYEFDMEGKYGVTPDGTVQKGAANSTMKPFRAYIDLSGASDEVSGVRIVIFDVTTGISRVLTSKEMNELNLFNLNGQRVDNSAKGVVIKGGKKVVVK